MQDFVHQQYLGVSDNAGDIILGSLYNKDPTISGTRLLSPIFGNPQSRVYQVPMCENC